MTTYLVLGARAPAALEICRGLSSGGNRVIAADSMATPVARWSRHVSKFHRIPAATDRQAYAEALARIVDEDGISMIIPTCEEVFHLAMVRDRLPPSCGVFADDIAKLRLLHDKYTFTKAATGCGIGIPRTLLLRSWRRLADSWERELTDVDLVYKRCFSRFAEGTLVRPKIDQVNRLRPSPTEPWIAQEFIPGEELCSYAVAVEGRMTALAIYRPLHRAGKGAGICFEPVVSPEIEEFVSRFVEKHGFTGQISFDYIVSPERGPFVIECNPRATSGVHLMPRDTDWGSVFSGTVRSPVRAGHEKAMVGLAMATYGLSSSRGAWRSIRDFMASKDVVMRKGDPMPALGQVFATAETLLRAFRDGISPLASTTSDIEWNGPLTDRRD
ncbi:ATP-grasp domain-containing protein [Agrobacterium salinitolerans]|nr:ATP-grasp domain-containing protein [Agrobacterium salinitolerans]